MNLLSNIKIHAQNILNIKAKNIMIVFVNKEVNLIRNKMLTDILVY